MPCQGADRVFQIEKREGLHASSVELVRDSLSGGASLSLPALPRMIFVVHGAVSIDGKAFTDGEAWSGEGAVSLTPGKDGTTVWRFELGGVGSRGCGRRRRALARETLG